MAWILVLFSSLMAFAGAEEAFPLGQLPQGWTYRSLTGFERGIENLPLEVNGVLERALSKENVVSIYVVMKPLGRGAARLPASQWNWVENTFVPQGIEVPKSYLINEQNKVGPQRKWNFRESKITRAGVPMNLAAFQSQNRFNQTYLVLRAEDSDYRRHLPHLKELMSALKTTR